jgi:hypothetical protein
MVTVFVSAARSFDECARTRRAASRRIAHVSGAMPIRFPARARSAFSLIGVSVLRSGIANDVNPTSLERFYLPSATGGRALPRAVLRVELLELVL